MTIFLVAEDDPRQSKKRQAIPASWIAKRKTVRNLLHSVAPTVLGRTPDLSTCAISAEEGDFISLDATIGDGLSDGATYIIHTEESYEFVLRDHQRKNSNLPPMKIPPTAAAAAPTADSAAPAPAVRRANKAAVTLSGLSTRGEQDMLAKAVQEAAALDTEKISAQDIFAQAVKDAAALPHEHSDRGRDRPKPAAPPMPAAPPKPAPSPKPTPPPGRAPGTLDGIREYTNFVATLNIHGVGQYARTLSRSGFNSAAALAGASIDEIEEIVGPLSEFHKQAFEPLLSKGASDAMMTDDAPMAPAPMAAAAGAAGAYSSMPHDGIMAAHGIQPPPKPDVPCHLLWDDTAPVQAASVRTAADKKREKKNRQKAAKMMMKPGWAREKFAVADDTPAEARGVQSISLTNLPGYQSAGASPSKQSVAPESPAAAAAGAGAGGATAMDIE